MQGADAYEVVLGEERVRWVRGSWVIEYLSDAGSENNGDQTVWDHGHAPRIGRGC